METPASPTRPPGEQREIHGRTLPCTQWGNPRISREFDFPPKNRDFRNPSHCFYVKQLQLLVSTFTSSARLTHPSYQFPFSRLRVYLPVLVVCVLMTHISFCCIQCVVIVLSLSSWSDNPLLLLSSFNPYLSDPLTLSSLIHLSHNDASPLSLFLMMSLLYY